MMKLKHIILHNFTLKAVYLSLYFKKYIIFPFNSF